MPAVEFLARDAVADGCSVRPSGRLLCQAAHARSLFLRFLSFFSLLLFSALLVFLAYS